MAGRPKIELDEEEMYELAKMWCTYAEIAAVFKVSKDTIKRNYAPLMKRGREEGKMSLRRAQYNAAVKNGNIAMLIWMGKQLLGQADKQEYTDTDTTVTFKTQAGPPEDLRKASAVKARARAVGNGDPGDNGAAAEDGAEEPDN